MYPLLGYFTNEDKYVIRIFFFNFWSKYAVTLRRKFVALLILPTFLSASKTGTNLVGQANKRGFLFVFF